MRPLAVVLLASGAGIWAWTGHRLGPWLEVGVLGPLADWRVWALWGLAAAGIAASRHVAVAPILAGFWLLWFLRLAGWLGLRGIGVHALAMVVFLAGCAAMWAAGRQAAREWPPAAPGRWWGAGALLGGLVIALAPLLQAWAARAPLHGWPTSWADLHLLPDQALLVWFGVLCPLGAIATWSSLLALSRGLSAPDPG